MATLKIFISLLVFVAAGNCFESTTEELIPTLPTESSMSLPDEPTSPDATETTETTTVIPEETTELTPVEGATQETMIPLTLPMPLTTIESHSSPIVIMTPKPTQISTSKAPSPTFTTSRPSTTSRCTPRACGRNEVYKCCGLCSYNTCIGWVGCIESRCVEGCFCKTGYVRITPRGICIPHRNCPNVPHKDVIKL